MQSKLAALFLIVLCLGFRGPGDDEPIVRPLDPFVFRTTLDERPQMISLALHPQLWVAYDAATCNLYKAWNGKINFFGAVFNSAPGPQPTTDGYAFVEYQEAESRWRLEVDGKEIVPKTHFKGYTLREQKLTFRYELELPDGQRIAITEYPEYSSKKNGEMQGLVRLFTTANVPKNVVVKMLLRYDSMLFGSDIKTDAKLLTKSKVKRHFDWGSLYDFEGELQLNANESTELKTYFAMSPELIVSGN